jgi:hypothetical protein
MSIFELLFIAVVLAGIVTLSLAGLSAIRGRRARAFSILKGVVIGAVIYFGIVSVVSLALPRRTLRVGQPLCFDDWCITVESAERTPSQSEVSYLVNLRLSSRARRVAQRENGIAVYLADAKGHRYSPLPDSSSPPLDAQLQPMESIVTTRTFNLPVEAQAAGLVIAHQGFPINWFIIGGGPFRREPIVLLQGNP